MTRALRLGLWRPLLGTLALLLAAAPAAAAQPAEPEPIEHTAARYISRVALIDLRTAAVSGSPSPDDYRVTASLLEAAHRLAPQDQIILRHLIEAAENADDSARVQRYTRELVKLDPADTGAQLRLISGTIRSQTVEARLAAYDRWLGPEGASVDASVRSRLALDAALLARERGDADGFIRRLSRSVELDATNKDAAALALAIYTTAVGEPVGKFELMLAVLGADPLDADLHLAIARHLAAHGAFQGADRFFVTYFQILQRTGQQGLVDEQIEANVAQWMKFGPRTLVLRLNSEQSDLREARRLAIQAAIAAEKPIEGLPKPADVVFPLSAEWLRLAAAIASGDEQLIVGALIEFLGVAQQEWEGLGETDHRPEGVSEEEAVARKRGLFEESMFARLLANRDLKDAATDMDKIRADSSSPDRLAAIEAWFRFRKGEIDTAERWFREHAGDNPLAALGLGMLLETRNEKPGAMNAYESLARAESGTLFGALAASRYQAVAGTPLPATPTLRKLEDLARGVPEWIAIFIDQPRRVIGLEARLVSDVIDTLEPARLVITLRNLSAAPLALGPDGPISSRFLIAPDAQLNSSRERTVNFRNVVTLDRRLRLGRQEALTAVVDAEMPELSTLLEQVGGTLARVRFQVLQGFIQGGNPNEPDVCSAGPFSVATVAGPLQRRLLLKSTLGMATLIGFVEQGAARDVAECIIAVNGRAFPEQTPPNDDLDKFYAALARRLPLLRPAEQALMLALAQPTVRAPQAAPLDEAGRALTDHAVRAVYLATRVTKPDDPALTDTTTVGNPELAALAALVRDRLTEGLVRYATQPPEAPETPRNQAVP